MEGISAMAEGFVLMNAEVVNGKPPCMLGLATASSTEVEQFSTFVEIFNYLWGRGI